MKFEEIENLNEEDITELYDDIIEFGDSTFLADCCCRGDVWYYGSDQYEAQCRAWCRSRGLTCKGWCTYKGCLSCPAGRAC